MDVFSGIVLADAPNQPLADAHEDESFILPILDGFREAIVPRLGDPRMPERILTTFGETLRKGSALYHRDTPSSGSLVPILENARERMGYWAFGLLIVCALRSGQPSADTATSEEQEAERRVAAGTVQPLMKRLETTLRQVVGDATLRGHIPFGRQVQRKMRLPDCY